MRTISLTPILLYLLSGCNSPGDNISSAEQTMIDPATYGRIDHTESSTTLHIDATHKKGLAELDGELLEPGGTFAIFSLTIPTEFEAKPSMPLPVAASFSWLEPSDAGDEKNDPLCTASEKRNAEGDVICGIRYMRQTIRGDEPNDLTLTFAAWEPNPGGRVAFTVKMSAYETWREMANPWCCTTAELTVDGVIDDDGKFVGKLALPNGHGWPGSSACLYGSLDEARATPCPASL